MDMPTAGELSLSVPPLATALDKGQPPTVVDSDVAVVPAGTTGLKRSLSLNEDDWDEGEDEIDLTGGWQTSKKKRKTRAAKKRVTISQPSAITSTAGAIVNRKNTKTSSLGKRVKNATTPSTAATPPTNATPPSIVTSVPTTSDLSVPNEECCVICAQATDQESVQCDLCEHFYHLLCCGVPQTSIAISLNLVSFAGWSCAACRSDLRREVKKLRNDLEFLRTATPLTGPTTLTATTGPTGSTGHTVQEGSTDAPTQAVRVSLSNAPVRSPLTNPAGAGQSLRNHSFVETVVRKTLRDASRRKCNIIVTG
jgi:hypothetical protein